MSDNSIKCYLCGSDQNLKLCETCGQYYCQNTEDITKGTCWGKHMRIAVTHVLQHKSERQ